MLYKVLMKSVNASCNDEILTLRMLYKIMMMKSVNASYNDENAHLKDAV